MTSTETISVTELEEMLNDELPCGGNWFPVNRPCPSRSAAVMASTHKCIKGSSPQEFKCLKCYQQWAMAQTYPTAPCSKCGRTLEILGLYRPL